MVQASLREGSPWFIGLHRSPPYIELPKRIPQNFALGTGLHTRPLAEE